MQLVKEDQPAQKMYTRGIASLSDTELISILIGGQVSTALLKAASLMIDSDSNLNILARKSRVNIRKFTGETECDRIVAALELGRRRQIAEFKNRPRITSSRDAFNVIAPLLTDLYHEEFWMLLLNQANEVIGRQKISSGGMTATVVDSRQFFRTAIEGKAVAVIAVHNHPSGNLKPSQADIQLTQKLVSAGKLIEIPVLDHLIVSERGFYSFADEGMI